MEPETVIDTQPGPQTQAAESNADILVFGGAAGGGKSYWLQMELAKYTHLPGYEAVLLRRTYTQLVGAGSIWEETKGLYPLLGGTYTEKPLRWRFPSGAQIWAAHLQHEKNLDDHQGKQYAIVGLDEVTQFNERMFWYLVGRMRTTCGIRPKLRATCNPDPDSFIAKLIDWWLDPEGFPDPERSGVVRYLWRDSGETHWGDTREELAHLLPEGADPEHFIQSFTFIGSKVQDNQALLKADPAYMARLHSLPPVEQARYLGGNWKVRPMAGDYFQRGWFRQVPDSDIVARHERAPVRGEIIKRLVMYDFASTPVRGDLVPGVERPEGFTARDPAQVNPDWSTRVLLSQTRQGHLVIEDVQRYRDSPGAIRQWVVENAKRDGPGVVVCLFKDPAQAGQDQFDEYVKALRPYARCIERPTIGLGAHSGTPAKERNARIASIAAYNGKIWVRSTTPNLADLFNELEAFPDKDKHDDWVDALSGAVIAMRDLPSSAFEYESAPPLPLERTDEWGDRIEDEAEERCGGTVGFERGL